MTENELIEWANAQKDCLTVIKKCDDIDYEYNLMVWHYVDGIGYVYAGFGRYFNNFDDAFSCAVKCSSKPVRLDFMPGGWHYNFTATTAPDGYEWANNGASRFDINDEYKSALVFNYMFDFDTFRRAAQH